MVWYRYQRHIPQPPMPRTPRADFIAQIAFFMSISLFHEEWISTAFTPRQSARNISLHAVVRIRSNRVAAAADGCVVRRQPQG
jgi:hypothetical protein